MAPNRIAIAALRLAAFQPSTWVTCALLLCLWPLYITLAPIGINSGSPNDSSILYDIAILSVAVGSLRGLALIAGVSRSMAHAATGLTLATTVLVVGSVGLLHAAIALSPALSIDGVEWGPTTAELGVRLALVLLILVAASGALLRLELPGGSAPWILGVASLLAPVLLPHPLAWRSLTLLASGLLWAAWLLDHPPRRTA